MTARIACPILSKEQMPNCITGSSYIPSSYKDIPYSRGLPQYNPLGH